MDVFLREPLFLEKKKVLSNIILNCLSFISQHHGFNGVKILCATNIIVSFRGETKTSYPSKIPFFFSFSYLIAM